jgi:hypothetical protein
LSTPPTALTAQQTERLTRRGLRLAQFTVAYNVVEGVVAVTAGLLAGLVSVIGFGFDSAIESIAAVLVALAAIGAAAPRRGRRTQRTTHPAPGRGLLPCAGRLRHRRRHPQPGRRRGTRALPGSDRAAGALADRDADPGGRQDTRRHRPAHNLILADAAETKICVLLSISTLLGVGLFQLTSAAWLDPVAGFVIAAFAIHEGREAWNGELVNDDQLRESGEIR